MSAPLFDTALIPPAVASLPDGYNIRPVRKSDYTQFLDVLRVLTTVGDISEEEWSARYDWMAARKGEYFIVCVTDATDKVVGVGSLIVEKKL